jgi:hypothetical protein
MDKGGALNGSAERPNASVDGEDGHHLPATKPPPWFRRPLQRQTPPWRPWPS